MTDARDLILVVEDDAYIRSHLEEVFTGDGFRVATAEHGRAALDYLGSADRLPSLILLDLMMPVLDGQGFIEELQLRPLDPRWTEIPVVVFTATHHEVRGRVAEYLRKPVDLDRLLEAAKSHARAPGSS